MFDCVLYSLYLYHWLIVFIIANCFVQLHCPSWVPLLCIGEVKPHSHCADVITKNYSWLPCSSITTQVLYCTVYCIYIAHLFASWHWSTACLPVWLCMYAKSINWLTGWLWKSFAWMAYDQKSIMFFILCLPGILNLVYLERYKVTLDELVCLVKNKGHYYWRYTVALDDFSGPHNKIIKLFLLNNKTQNNKHFWIPIYLFPQWFCISYCLYLEHNI